MHPHIILDITMQNFEQHPWLMITLPERGTPRDPAYDPREQQLLSRHDKTSRGENKRARMQECTLHMHLYTHCVRFQMKKKKKTIRVRGNDAPWVLQTAIVDILTEKHH